MTRDKSFYTGARGTGDFLIQEKSPEDITKEALQRTRWLQQEEQHIEVVINSLNKITRGKRPKDIPLPVISNTAKSVLLELKKLDGAFNELKYKNGSESAVKAVQEFIDYKSYWEFLYKKGKLPGYLDLNFSILKFNVKTVEHVLEDIAKFLGKSASEFKNILKEAHKKFSRSSLNIIKH